MTAEGGADNDVLWTFKKSHCDDMAPDENHILGSLHIHTAPHLDYLK